MYLFQHPRSQHTFLIYYNVVTLPSHTTNTELHTLHLFFPLAPGMDATLGDDYLVVVIFNNIFISTYSIVVIIIVITQNYILTRQGETFST